MPKDGVTTPHWLEGAEVTQDAALLAVRKLDGTKVGYRVPRRSLLDTIAKDAKSSVRGRTTVSDKR